MGTFGGLSQIRASGFRPSGLQQPRGTVPVIGHRSFEDEMSKTDVDSPRNVPGEGHDATTGPVE
jgi:hypothetical protein